MSNGKNAATYLEKHKEDISKENHKALKEFQKENELKLAEKTLYDYVSRLKSLLEKFAPEDFDLSEPSQEEIRGIAKKISKSDYTTDTIQTYYKILKKFYKTFEDGKYYELTDCFKVSGSSRGVEKHMILSPSEVRDIIDSASNVRNKAFFRLMYECAATSGELLQAQVQDVDLEEETIYIRGNKNHRSQTMELHNEGLAYLREYLNYHPAVEDIFSTNCEEPLWIKLRAHECKECGKTKTAHGEDNTETCDNYEPNKIEEVGYRSFLKSFNKAVGRSSVDRDVKMKYFRKSMLTRLCAESIGYEQLNNFARWQPGSTQAAHYVSISNDKLRNWVKEKFKGEGDTGKDIIECKNCGARNPADNVECKKCHRPLNAPKSEKMRKAKEIADRLSEFDEDRLQKVENNLELLENPEELIEQKIEEKLGNK